MAESAERNEGNYRLLSLSNGIIIVESFHTDRRDNITIGTWNTRTLWTTGKRQELTNEMDRYKWNILGLSEMSWKNFGETTTEEGHKFSSVEKMINTSMALGSQGHRELCHGISPGFQQARRYPPGAVPFNMTVVQAYALTLHYDDNETEFS